MAGKLPRLTGLLGLMPGALCMVDADGMPPYAGAAFERIQGYPRGTLPSHLVFEMVHPDDGDATRQQAARPMQGPGGRHFRNRHLHRAGHAVDLLWSAQWLPGHGVRVTVAREISELRRAGQDLEHRANRDALTRAC
ncbi:MAG: PAS domain S-box protein [Pseudomonadota bacterium]